LIRAVLLDAVGTLVVLREPVGATYARVAAAHGVRTQPARVETAFRRALAAAPPAVFPDAPRDEVPTRERAWWRAVARATFRAAEPAQRFADFDACFDELWRRFAGPEAWAPARGAAEALRALRAAGRRCAVVSNFDRRLPGLLAGLGLAPLLDACVLPSDTRAAKPDPRIFRAALQALGAEPAEAAFVGDDRARDLEPARALGMHPVDVASLATLADLPARIATLEAGTGREPDSAQRAGRSPPGPQEAT
jgi:putative hydrolase of the HAD superfamily